MSRSPITKQSNLGIQQSVQESIVEQPQVLDGSPSNPTAPSIVTVSDGNLCAGNNNNDFSLAGMSDDDSPSGSPLNKQDEMANDGGQPPHKRRKTETAFDTVHQPTSSSSSSSSSSFSTTSSSSLPTQAGGVPSEMATAQQSPLPFSDPETKDALTVAAQVTTHIAHPHGSDCSPAQLNQDKFQPS